MEIISSHKGQTVKTAVVAGATCDEDARRFAMEFFGEKEHNLFGTNVHLGTDQLRRVELFID